MERINYLYTKQAVELSKTVHHPQAIYVQAWYDMVYMWQKTYFTVSDMAVAQVKIGWFYTMLQQETPPQQVPESFVLLYDTVQKIPALLQETDNFLTALEEQDFTKAKAILTIIIISIMQNYEAALLYRESQDDILSSKLLTRKTKAILCPLWLPFEDINYFAKFKGLCQFLYYSLF